jgi:putative ABC transport system permease protein
MTIWRYVGRSLRHHGLHHLPVILGTAIAGAVLLSALYVGDSVGAGLTNLAEARTGGAGLRVLSHGAPMTDGLAGRLAASGVRGAAPVWHVEGMLSTRDGRLEVGDVHLYGVTDAFWQLAGGRPPPPEVHRMNAALAAQFGAKGQGLTNLVFRGRAQSAMAGDTPMSIPESETPGASVWGTAYGGPAARIGPPNQAAEPLNLFVPLGWLQAQLQLGETANEIWIPQMGGDAGALAHRTELALIKGLGPADVGLSLESGAGGVTLKSDAFLLPPAVAARALALPHRRAHLTWFVDTVRSADRSAPFSFVSALEADDDPRVAELGEKDALVNRWLADDLGLEVGAAIELAYHRVSDPHDGVPRGRTTLRVAGILEMSGLGADRSLTPDYPGIASAKKCRDWDPGVPMDRSRIRADDERYWGRYGAAPKVLLPLATGRAIWGSRFGDVNEVLLRETHAETTVDRLLAGVSPQKLGLRIERSTEVATRAGQPASDFGALFLGFSFILVLASLLLTGLLVGLSLHQRRPQIATLRRLGIEERIIRRLTQAELLVLSLAGALGAVLLAPVLTAWAVEGLQGAWSDAVAGVEVPVHFSPLSTLLGSLATVLLTWLVGAYCLGHALSQESPKTPTGSGRLSRAAWLRWGALGLGCCAGVTTAAGLAGADASPTTVFFLAGALFLGGSLCLVVGALRGSQGAGPISTSEDQGVVTTRLGLAVRGMQRNPGRSMAVIASLSLTTFLVVGVGAHVPGATGAEDHVSAATGGFEFLIETTSPIPVDLRHLPGQSRMGLGEEDLAGVTLWPLRVRTGDDASCLSPGSAGRPHLLGVDGAALAARGAFTFIATAEEGHGWDALETVTPAGHFPAIGDEATLRWGLGLGIGDTFEDVSEAGEAITFEIVGMLDRTMLQGALFVSEGHLAAQYPRAAPFRMVLVDGEPGHVGPVREALLGALGDLGPRASTSRERLARYRSVETSYVRIFLAIGLLGVLLGACGVAVLLARHALERRREFAVLRAVGHSRGSLWASLNAEHFALVLSGLALGGGAAFLGLWPGLEGAPGGAPATALTLLGGIVATAFVVTSLVAWLCVQGEPGDVLASTSR